jgi:hypothetical protein
VSDSNHSKNSSSGADEKFSTKFGVTSRNTLLRYLALFVATFGGVIPMADNLREMFGRRDVAKLGDCSNEPRRICLFSIPEDTIAAARLDECCEDLRPTTP